MKNALSAAASPHNRRSCGCRRLSISATAYSRKLNCTNLIDCNPAIWVGSSRDQRLNVPFFSAFRCISISPRVFWTVCSWDFRLFVSRAAVRQRSAGCRADRASPRRIPVLRNFRSLRFNHWGPGSGAGRAQIWRRRNPKGGGRQTVSAAS